MKRNIVQLSSLGHILQIKELKMDIDALKEVLDQRDVEVWSLKKKVGGRVYRMHVYSMYSFCS